MDEQLVQSLLFVAMIGAMAVLSLIESLMRRSKQRREMERLEEEERRGGGVARREAEARTLEPSMRIPLEEYDLWGAEEAPEAHGAPGGGEIAHREADLPSTDLAAEAERLRQESRRALQAESEAPEIEVSAPAPRALPSPTAPAPGRRRRRRSARALREALRGDPKALEDAVLYREILGPPLGSRPEPGGWDASPR